MWKKTRDMTRAEFYGGFATDAYCIRAVSDILELLEPDDFIKQLLKEYPERLDSRELYADLVTVLFSISVIMSPKTYLEVGVRRGRSMAVVASVCPECRIVGFDTWEPVYSGMPTPGPEFVVQELKKVGYKGCPVLISGDSHLMLQAYFSTIGEDSRFDLITVDGDHSHVGATQDLLDVLPWLRVGGVIVFDDIVLVPHLRESWRVVSEDPRFSCWEWTANGYGVALAVKDRE